jgi:DNA invertase Pin-like site-specific DNA recombinase
MSADAVPVVALGVRSAEKEPGRDSAGDQARLAAERALCLPGRFLYAEPFIDHGSGFRGNRGEQHPGGARRREAGRRGARTRRAVGLQERAVARGSGRQHEARSVLEVYVEMRRAGVDLRSVEDDAYFTNPMLIGVADAMAHKYAEDLSAHVRRGLAERKARGAPVGAIPLGYRAEAYVNDEGKANSRRVVDPAGEALYLRMVADAERELAPGAISRALERRRPPDRPRPAVDDAGRPPGAPQRGLPGRVGLPGADRP